MSHCNGPSKPTPFGCLTGNCGFLAAFDDVVDPIETNLNLTRSLIEMSEFKKAKDCLYKVEISSDLTQKQKEKAKVLRQRLKDKENG